MTEIDEETKKLVNRLKRIKSVEPHQRVAIEYAIDALIENDETINSLYTIIEFYKEMCLKLIGEREMRKNYEVTYTLTQSIVVSANSEAEAKQKASDAEEHEWLLIDASDYTVEELDEGYDDR